MISDRDRQTTAETRVRLTLDSIQEALRLIERATDALRSVPAMLPERRRLDSLSGHLSQTWFAVSAGVNRLRRKGRLRVA